MNTININYDEKEDYKLYILNEKNKYVTHEFITNILKKYNIIYKPTDLSLFQKAMTHESYLKRDFRIDKIVKSIKEKNIQPCPTPLTAIPLQIYSYERLEFLGDSVLHHILADYLYDRYDDKDEGFLTKLRTKIENGDTLSNFARILGLHEYVLIARNIEQIGGRNNNDHIFEDTFEAFFGATTYILDNNFKNGVGYSVSYDILKGIFDDISISTEFEQLNDPISILKEFFDKNKDYGTIEYVCNKIGINQYCDVVLTTSDGNKIILGNGVSTKKPNAKENAAINSIEYLKKKGYKI